MKTKWQEGEDEKERDEEEEKEEEREKKRMRRTSRLKKTRQKNVEEKNKKTETEQKEEEKEEKRAVRGVFGMIRRLSSAARSSVGLKLRPVPLQWASEELQPLPLDGEIFWPGIAALCHIPTADLLTLLSASTDL